jgi:hypothetical protein
MLKGVQREEYVFYMRKLENIWLIRFLGVEKDRASIEPIRVHFKKVLQVNNGECEGSQMRMVSLWTAFFKVPQLGGLQKDSFIWPVLEQGSFALGGCLLPFFFTTVD